MFFCFLIPIHEKRIAHTKKKSPNYQGINRLENIKQKIDWCPRG